MTFCSDLGSIGKVSALVTLNLNQSISIFYSLSLSTPAKCNRTARNVKVIKVNRILSCCLFFVFLTLFAIQIADLRQHVT